MGFLLAFEKYKVCQIPILIVKVINFSFNELKLQFPVFLVEEL